VVALLFDHLQLSRPLIISMHTLFGILTCAAICLALIPNARSLAEGPQAELYLFVRSVSRWVYILLYGLAIVRVSFNLYDATQHCALCGARSATGSVRSLDDFQFYIGCCIVPLWLVRAVVLTVPFNPIHGFDSSTTAR
jgi:hypothetical protein